MAGSSSMGRVVRIEEDWALDLRRMKRLPFARFSCLVEHVGAAGQNRPASIGRSQ